VTAHDRIAIDLATRTSWPAGHVVHMSLDHRDHAQSVSVAECDCGWEFRIAWPGNYQLQDQAIEQHWQRAENLNPQLGLSL
jgi:hypothetical protein